MGGLFLLVLKPREHLVRPVGAQGIRGKERGNLRREGFFADIGLRTSLQFVFLGAAVVGVAFLDFGGDGRAALGAAKKTREGFRLALFWGRIPPAPIEHGLHLVKQLLGNDWLVDALVDFAAATEMAVVDGVCKHLRNESAAHELAVSRAHAVLGEKAPHVVEGGFSRGV
ncbi:MAG: hypothetical protein ABSA97_13930 [Verrucomicrobiia bacterium]